MTEPFQGKTVLITGASSGIGEAFARSLAKRGTNLILVARNGEKLRRLAEELSLSFAIRAESFVCDLSQMEAIHDLYEGIKQKKLHVDILINNAGLGWIGEFEKAPLYTLTQLTAVNINAVIVLTQLCLRDMVKRGSGGIINVASTAAFQALPYLSLYGASKAFVLSFSEALWGEYESKGIRVLCLCPGNTRTAFHERAGIEEKRIFFAAAPEKVAEHGLNVFARGCRPTTVFGLRNRLLTWGPRFLPRPWVVMITKFLYQKGSG